MGKRKTFAEFERDGIAKHDGKYTYPGCKYTNSKTKIPIMCPVGDHGIFYQTPSHHLSGQGCPKCGVLHVEASIRLTFDEFTIRSNALHNDKFTYPGGEYHGAKVKIPIMCPVGDHGIFMQEPSSHLSGCGCPKCGTEQMANKCRITFDVFKERSTKRHSGKYNYPNQPFGGVTSFVNIECLSHGIFQQRAYHHVDGSGCPKCAYSYRFNSPERIAIMKTISPGFLYRVELQHSNPLIDELFTKIGISKDPNARFIKFGNYMVVHAHIEEYPTMYDAWVAEQKIHNDPRSTKYQYEPLEYFGGYTECYLLPENYYAKLDIRTSPDLGTRFGCYNKGVV